MNVRVKPRIAPAARPKTWLDRPKNLARRRRIPGMNLR
jgi:hypothetical protein